MNRNLSPQEFGQLEFPGMPEAVEVQPTPDTMERKPFAPPRFDENSPWGAPNPIFSDDTYDTYAYALEPAGVDVGHAPPGARTKREWVPTESLTSPQAEISPVGVTDYAARETFPPPVQAVKYGGEHIVVDGNHRANANIARGRLITEADVFDYENWRDTEGW